MIDGLVQVLDRMMQLLTVRSKRRRRLFEAVWEPTFTQLRAVHGDYLGMFEACSSQLAELEEAKPGDAVPRLERITRELRSRRLEFEPARRQLLALIDHSQRLDLDREAAAFVEAVLWYFPTGTNRSLPTSASETLGRLQGLIESVDLGSNADRLEHGSLRDLADYVHGAIRHQRTAWDHVCDTYAQLQSKDAGEAVL